jgi:hypothetical protein
MRDKLTDEERIQRRRESRAKWLAKNPNYFSGYAKANRESINASSAKYIAANPGYHAAYREANKERLTAYRAAQYEANRERVLDACKQYRLANLEQKRAKDKAYQQANLHKFNAMGAKRRACRRSAIPAWADLDAIAVVYKKARDLGMHVDHVVPLQGKTVCGLHVWENLQLLAGAENISKGNRHWPDMP